MKMVFNGGFSINLLSTLRPPGVSKKNLSNYSTFKISVKFSKIQELLAFKNFSIGNIIRKAARAFE